MLGWICEKMATQESALGGGKFFAFGSIVAKKVPHLAATRALQAGIVQLPLGMVLGTTHIHLTRLVGVKGWAENQVLWCNAHNVQVGAQMVKLATLQRVQPVGVRFTMGGSINREAGAPPLSGFPHTMLNVKRVKDNMRSTFIEKLFTNRKIGTNV
jgi:hypothetical protein